MYILRRMLTELQQHGLLLEGENMHYLRLKQGAPGNI
jgi:hypothetical protein